MFVSYAQAREDILLVRALRAVSHEVGFYIDVGAYDAEQDSVTKLFYDHGWRGINVEPSPVLFKGIADTRTRDINLQLAVSDSVGEVTFYENSGQLGTVVERFANRGPEARSFKVETTTLTDICERYAPPEIHFLKIDVEGHEGAVIRGMDFGRFRPWIIVIESTEPNRLDRPTYEEWDAIVKGAGYKFVYTDVLNRYYVSDKHTELAQHFSVPADDYVYARYEHRIKDLERQVQELNLQLLTV